MSKLEQTLSIIKPDAVERNLENEIKEITLSDLPTEIDTILKGQQIGRIRVKI